MRVSVKQTVSWILALALVLPGAMIFSQPLEAGAVETSTHADSLSAEPVKVPAGETAADVIANPAQPEIYTLHNDYKITRAGKTEVNYQPYVATVGEAATDAEKAKVGKTITLPKFANYDNPKDAANNTINNYDITYQGIVSAATGAGATKTGDTEYGIAHNALRDFLYKGVGGTIRVRHAFQDLKDFSKYGPKPGESDYRYTTQSGNLGELPLIEALPDNETKGFVPEDTGMKVVIAKDLITVDKRYNRDHFNVTYDTVDGTPVPAHTLYYGQVIPPLADSDIPTKIGATFVGWKPSVELTGTLNRTKTTFPAGQIMKDGSGNTIEKLDAKLIMPATNVKFTAVWQDSPRADYAIQFWTEKSDHDADASLLEKYDFVGTRVYSNKPTGTRPDLAAEPVKDVVFPDLDKARLQKIWNGDTFGGRYPFLYLNKFYTYNKDLTNSENADPNAANLVKPVSATGKTVYNIYFDRQVYDLYFTKSNSRNNNDTFYPEIWRHQQKIGWPGHPYHFKARFNQRLLDWPNDALETKGFTGDKQSFGWDLNYADTTVSDFRDTPPYRLTAAEFLDMPEYNNRGGYTSDIDAGAGVTIKVNRKATTPTFTTLSFGIWQSGSRDGPRAVPHHMDFWMDGFEENPNWNHSDPKEKYKKIIDYDLYRNKADTGSPDYGHPAPIVQGFTPYETHVQSEPLTEDELEALNDERADIKEFPSETVESPYEGGDPHPKGYMPFMHTFFNRADEFGDVADGSEEFETNGYICFRYKRNKYKLRFNNDPATIKADNDYHDDEQTEIFYKKPLQDLDLNKVDTLSNLGLDGLLKTDGNGNTHIKRPEGLEPNKVFKGWALDPAGLKRVSESDETMPAHALVLYAIWEEPDFKWKVTFDPDGGTLPDISETKVATNQKTISEFIDGQEQDVTYPIKATSTNEGDKQVFTVLHRQKLVELQGNAKPTKEGYSFSGWEVLHYQKDANGEYTDQVDTSYHDAHGVPELYTFGNDVVDPIYLKAIWVPKNTEKVTIYHHYLDKEYRIDNTVSPNPSSRIIENQPAGQFVRTSAEQNADWRLATHEELQSSTDQELHRIYDEYNERLGLKNAYFQALQVQPKKIMKNGQLVDNPDYKYNAFHFFYVPFRTRNYKVNYVDQRAKTELAQANTPAERQQIIDKYRILDQEMVESKARHYDARNYKPISGWKLTSDPQQQLFYDVDEDTNKLIGINGTGSDEITFYYQDVRILEVPSTGTTPPGYVRVTFKAGAGGSFGSDTNGAPITELHYDVLKGIKSKQLPIPQQLGGTRDPNKYYVTPDSEKSFDKWDTDPLTDTPLNDNTVFTAQFSGAAPGGNPGTPTPNPTTPAPTPNPTTPGTPGGGTPTTPGGTPSSPVSPTPTKTSTPTSPATPSTPSQPETPASPSTPSQPGTPASPGIPGMPSAPASPSVPNQPNPQDKLNAFDTTVTGANSLLYLYAAVLFTATGGLMLRISRKRAQGSRA